MHPRRSIARTSSRLGGGLVVAMLAVGVGASGCTDAGSKGASGSATSSSKSQPEFAAKAAVAELSSALAALLDRPLVTPSIEADTDADELASGAAAVAVTEGIDRSTGTAMSYRIVLDPAALDAAGDESSRALLAHELVHLYLQPVTDPATPLWLVEGIADFVGYRVAGTDLDAVRAGITAAPTPTVDLPQDAAFASPDAQIQATAYAEAWLAMEYLGQTIGESGTIALFRTVAASPAPNDVLDTQLMSTLGVTRSAFVQQWLAYLDGVL